MIILYSTYPTIKHFKTTQHLKNVRGVDQVLLHNMASLIKLTDIFRRKTFRAMDFTIHQ